MKLRRMLKGLASCALVAGFAAGCATIEPTTPRNAPIPAAAPAIGTPDKAEAPPIGDEPGNLPGASSSIPQSRRRFDGTSVGRTCMGLSNSIGSILAEMEQIRKDGISKQEAARYQQLKGELASNVSVWDDLCAKIYGPNPRPGA